MKTNPNVQNAAELDRKLQPVARAIACGEAVLCPCNGFSMSVGAPSWDQLIQLLKSELVPPTVETDLCLIAQFYRNQYGHHRFFTRVREILGKKILRPGPAHAALADLPVNVILTTNFDDLLERALEESSKTVHVIRDDSELALWNERSEVQLLKIHGDLDAASTMVLSGDDYHRFLARNLAMRHKLEEFFRYKTVVFIGCSLRDADIALIHHETQEGSGSLNRAAYNLTFTDDPHLLHEWVRRGIEPIQIPCLQDEDKGTALARALRRLKQLVEREKGECDVLIVDDDESFREFMPKLLQSVAPNASVEVAKNGYEAANKLKELNPKIVLVDICLDGPESLEGLNGFKFVESFRGKPGFEHMQFVMISGFPDEVAVPETNISIAQYAKSLGLPFFYKPTSLNPIASIIERRLSLRAAA